MKIPLWINGEFHLPSFSIQNVSLGLNPPFFKAEFGSNPFQARRCEIINQGCDLGSHLGTGQLIQMELMAEMKLCL